MMKKQACIWLLALCFAAPAVLASDVPLKQSGTWHIGFSGVPFAKLWVGLREPAAGQFAVAGTLKSVGLMRMFKVVKTEMRSKLSLRGGVPRTREINLIEEKDSSRIELAYDADGQLTHRLVQPEDGVGWRPRVPDAEVTDAYSWTGLLFALQRAQQEGRYLTGEPVIFNLYDGKRLMELTFTYVGGEELDGVGATDKLALTRRYLNGYTPKEMTRWEEGEPPLYVYLRAGDGFPARMELALSYGTVAADWEEEIAKR